MEKRPRENMSEVLVPLARLKGIGIDIATKEVIARISMKPTVQNGKDLMDPRFGLPNPEGKCSTCGESDVTVCEGHFGCIASPRVIYNPLLIGDVVEILNNICPYCYKPKKMKEKRCKVKSLLFLDADDKRSNVTTNEKSCKFKHQHVTNEKRNGFKRQDNTSTDAEMVILGSSDEEEGNPRCHRKESSLKTLKLKRDKPARYQPVRNTKRNVNYSEDLHNKGAAVKKDRATRKGSGLDRKRVLCKSVLKRQNSANLRESNPTKASQDTNCVFCQADGKKPEVAVSFKLASEIINRKVYQTIRVEARQRGKTGNYAKDCLKSISGREVDDNMPTKNVTLPPARAREILRQVDEKIVPRPDSFFIEFIAVTPNSHRINERHQSFKGSVLTPDDRTKALKLLMQFIERIRGFKFREDVTVFDTMKIVHSLGRLTNDYFQCNKLSDTCPPVENVNRGESQNSHHSGLKWLKDTALGKRSDFSLRAVVIGDPNLQLDEIGINRELAERLTVSETVNRFNRRKIREYNNHRITKGLSHNTRRNGVLSRGMDASQLKIGDLYERQITDGDLIIINRTPTLHRHSLISFKIKVLNIESAISINPIVCAPFGADFDGDCLHGFIPQSLHSKAEALNIMSLSKQLLNSQCGQSVVSLSQDSLVAAFLLTSSHIFLKAYQMQQLHLFCSSEIPMPAILKAPKLQGPLWTGKQLFQMTLPSNLNYKSSEVFISEGEILSCSGTSKWLSESDSSLMQKIIRDFPSSAVHYIGCCQSMLNEFISLSGFSVSLLDIHLARNNLQRLKMVYQINSGLIEAKKAMFAKQMLLDRHAHRLLIEEGGIVFCNSQKNLVMETRKYNILHEDILCEFRNIYSDIIKVVLDHTQVGNSMVAMVKSGSKGSFQKLVQQGAFLGIQFYRDRQNFPFGFPPKLYRSFHTTVIPKESTSQASKCKHLQGSLESINYLGLIGSSFFEGLNPFEYFIHSVSSRGNSFSQGADVPGRLFRRLMFFLRDIVVAYDGTVRNLYGNQIVQFSYSNHIQDNLEIDSPEAGLHLAGEAMGALAASSLGEMAYGILEKQLPSGHSHPLQILQEILGSGQGKDCCKKILLRLSRDLRNVHCGLEYGALLVKHHLETVELLQLTERYGVVFDSQIYHKIKHSKEGLSFTSSPVLPWVIHFSLSKEKLREKGLEISKLLNILKEEYANTLSKFRNLKLPNILFMGSECCRNGCQYLCSNDKIFNSVCVNFVAETSSVLSQGNSEVEVLKLFSEVVIPKLLRIHVKGVQGVRSVVISGDQYSIAADTNSKNGELVLLVEISSDISALNSWKLLLKHCEAVTDIIDWNRSYPVNPYGVSHSLGIEAAKQLCLQRLECFVKMVEKPVHRRHLTLVTDCLCLTGAFNCLKNAALKKTVTKGLVEAPFMQACLTNPKKILVEAAKKGMQDNLLGSLDSLIWGNAPPLGTSGGFEILLNKEEMPSCSEPIVVDEILEITAKMGCKDKPLQSNRNQKTAYDRSMRDSRRVMEKKAKYNSYVQNDKVSIPPKESNRSSNHILGDGWQMQSKNKDTKSLKSILHVSSKVKNSEGKQEVLPRTLREILHSRYMVGQSLSETDKSLVENVLRHHPHYEEKVGNGLQGIKIGKNPDFPDTRCFMVERKDGSCVDFSYLKCLSRLNAPGRTNAMKEKHM